MLRATEIRRKIGIVVSCARSKLQTIKTRIACVVRKRVLNFDSPDFLYRWSLFVSVGTVSVYSLLLFRITKLVLLLCMLYNPFNQNIGYFFDRGKMSPAKNINIRSPTILNLQLCQPILFDAFHTVLRVLLQQNGQPNGYWSSLLE